MAKKLIFILSFMIIYSLVFTSALLDSGTQTNVNPSNGIEVDYPKFDIVKTNQPFNLTIFNYNITDGKVLLGSNCSLELFNHTGSRVYNVTNLSATGNGYFHFIAGGNFTVNDIYNFNIYCSNQDIAGFASGLFEINSVGDQLTSAKSTFYATFFGLLFFLFVVNLVVISKLPKGNMKDPTGQIVTTTNMKYVTMLLVAIEWLFIFGMLFISSNLASAYFSEQLFAKYLLMLWKLSFVFSGVFAILWVIWIGFNVVEDREIKNMFNRGLSETGKPTSRGNRY